MGKDFRLISDAWVALRRRRRIQIVLLLLLMVIGSLFEMVGVGAIVPFLTVLIKPELVAESDYWKNISYALNFSKDIDLQKLFAVAFIFAVILASVIKFLIIFSQARLVAVISYELNLHAYKTLLRQPYTYHVSKNSSELISLVNKAGDLAHIFILPILNFLNSMIVAIGIFLTLLYVNTIIALAALFGFGILYSVMYYLARLRVQKYSEIISDSSVGTIKALQEGFGGIRDVILDKLYSFYSKIYAESCFSQKVAAANVGLISTAPRFLVEAIGVIFISVSALIMVKTDGGIEQAIPVLGALALGAQRLLPMLQQAFASYTTLRGYIVSSSNAIAVLQLDREFCCEHDIIGEINFSDSVVFKDISFKHDNQSRFVLKDINLELQKGSRLGIIGPTGCGKSTLLDLFMGLLQPTKGGVYIDGKLLASGSVSAWQEEIAHVPQFIYLSDSSIAENIAFGCSVGEIDMTKIVACAELAQLSGTIKNLPGGYKTTVGERGVRLSGGQRQRVGIARALYKGASIIIFDEATSALDSGTEDEVVNSIDLASKGVTMVMVAHRTTTLRTCDQIIELNSGKIQWVGSYGELLIKQGAVGAC